MRIGVVSDIHGNLVALEAVLADMKDRAVDLVLNLGDCVTSPLWPRETLELITSTGMVSVRGNRDRWLSELAPVDMHRTIRFTREALDATQRAALGILPATIELEGVLACHGRPQSDSQYLMEDDVDGRLSPVTKTSLAERLMSVEAGLILCGHSHVQHVARADRHRVVVNPGSVGCPRYADNPRPQEAEAGSPHARYAIVTRRRGEWSADLIVLHYDWAPVVTRARANGRADWAAGFLGHEHAETAAP